MNREQADDIQWLVDNILQTTEVFEHYSPIEYNEERRYLPTSVTSDPGYINFDRTPYWIEILECFDVRSPVREVAVLKAVQTAYSTILESILLYFAGHVRTAPVMYANATIDMARARINNNYIPMFEQSGMSHIFQSSHVENSRKQGITKSQIQWIGGGYMVPRGAQTPHMMRDISILLMLMDELDAWPEVIDGNPVQLFKDRTTGFTDVRKIFMGSTPSIVGGSKIDIQYERGDKRKYLIRCLKCGMPQELRFDGKNDNGKHYGLEWEMKGKTLDIDSVRYHCKNCLNPHMEHDKIRMITKENAYWEPTEDPDEPFLRSYQVTGMMSRRSPWYKGVSMYLEAFDKNGKVKDFSALQRWYNNFLAKSIQIYSGKVSFSMASAHRRPWYRKNEIPNTEIEKYCPSEILLLTCTVDVHKGNLAVAVWGWTAGMRCWLIDYIRIEDDTEAGCEVIESMAWVELGKMINERAWKANDGKVYQLALTFVDARWSSSTVVEFCSQYSSGVYPIMGDDKPARGQRIKEFAEFTTQSGTTGYRITVNHYKDRLAPVLRRNWRPDEGLQDEYTFNAPVDTTDDELRELTREVKRKKTLPNGQEEWFWHRPGGAPQELWDLMVYGHAQVEILAWMMCVQHLEVDAVDWPWFWNLLKEQKLYFSDSK